MPLCTEYLIYAVNVEERDVVMDKILVVDDQIGIRLLLSEFFNEDYEVKVVDSGEKALLLFKTFQPNLILMDMKMPVMDGIETLKQIRDSDRQVPVIMMTGYSDDSKNMEQAHHLGIASYVAKPFDLFKLREQVSEVLNGIGLGLALILTV